MRGRLPFSRSLLYPLTAVMVGLTVLPLALAGWGFVSSNREQVATLEMQYLTRQAVGLARELELFFLDSTGRIETVVQALRPVTGGRVEEEVATGVLTEMVRKNQNIVLLRLLDRAGLGPFVQTRPLPETASHALDGLLSEAFAANITGKPVRRDLVRLDRVTPPVALVSLPVLDLGGKVAGAMQGVVTLEPLAARIAEDSGRGATIDVVDRGGAVIFSTEPQRVGLSARGHPLVMQFLVAPVRLTKTYRDPLRLEQDEVLGSLCPVESPPWAVVTARDVGVAFAAVSAMAQRTLVLVGATALVAMLAGVAIARRITLPLRHLAELSTALARGEFERRVPVTSDNELGQLAQNYNVMAAEIARYVESLRAAVQENQELLVDSIRALAAAIDAKNPYTRGHSERVSQYAVAVARQAHLSEKEIRRVEISALLHDVGKIGIEDAILQKPEALTETEFAQMRSHTLKGAAIVSPIKRLRDTLPGIRSHHENWDGSGYPDGMKGDQIPVQARIIAIADVFDAMTTLRPYQKPLSLDFVYNKLRDLSGRKLDPSVVEAFFAAVQAGELVPLASVEVA
jgi:HD-GYP domain-containing protein (c-di-GMP phosphodiesterase class II)